MKIVFTFLFFISIVFGGEFILRNDSVVLDKAAVKIEEMSKELYSKTKIGVYLSALHKLPDGVGITQAGLEEAKSLEAPYALIIFSSSDKQVDLILSDDLVGKIDKEEILDTYIIKILVTYNKNISEIQKHSAGILNGMAELTDELAATKNIVLDSSIGSESKETYEILAMIVKIMLIITILAIGRIWYYRKR